MEKISKSQISDICIDLYTTKSVEDFLNSSSIGGYIPLKKEESAIQTPFYTRIHVEAKSIPKPNKANIESKVNFQPKPTKLAKGALMHIAYYNDKFYTRNHLENNIQGEEVIHINDLIQYENYIDSSGISSTKLGEDKEFIEEFKRNFRGVEYLIIRENVSEIDFQEAKEKETTFGMTPIKDMPNSFIIGGTDYSTIRRILDYSKQHQKKQ
jgi:hypothetical protein